MLTATSEYALRALIRLARLPKEISILGRELAEQSHIPRNYLVKILVALRNVGMVEAGRGQGGGYRLSKPPEQIRLIDVVEVFEGIRSKPGCLLGENPECSDEHPCSAHAAWREVRHAYMQFLTTKTIADIAAPTAPPLVSLAAESEGQPPSDLMVSASQETVPTE